MGRYQIRSKILVVTEGYTEKRYFEKFRKRGADYEVIVKKSPDNNAKRSSNSVNSKYGIKDWI